MSDPMADISQMGGGGGGGGGGCSADTREVSAQEDT